MSDFIIDGEDYIDLLKSEEDFKKFHRMKELWESGEFAKPAKEVIHLIIEFDHLRSDLHGEPRRKFLIQGNPQNN